MDTQQRKLSIAYDVVVMTRISPKDKIKSKGDWLPDTRNEGKAAVGLKNCKPIMYCADT